MQHHVLGCLRHGGSTGRVAASQPPPLAFEQLRCFPSSWKANAPCRGAQLPPVRVLCSATGQLEVPAALVNLRLL